MRAQTVLVVDDHAGFRSTARRLLERDGWSVVGEAADGRSALLAVARFRPDLVLLDVGLPDMDGFDVARRLASDAGTHRPPAVVLISSRDREAYGSRVDQGAVRGFVPKSELDGARLRALLDGWTGA